jgi:hypothetical protein
VSKRDGGARKEKEYEHSKSAARKSGRLWWSERVSAAKKQETYGMSAAADSRGKGASVPKKSGVASEKQWKKRRCTVEATVVEEWRLK